MLGSQRYPLLILLPTVLTALLVGCGNKAQFSGATGTQATERTNLRTPANQSADAVGASERVFLPPGSDPTSGDLPGVAPTTALPPPAPAPAPDPTPDPPGTDGSRITRSMTFSASQDLDAQVTQTLDQATLSQDLTLHRTPVDKQQVVTQGQPPAAEDDFQQTTGDKDITQTFYGASDRLLDVLLVLDNGCNMHGLEEDYAHKLAPLLDSVAATDWQIGVVTTDPYDTCIRQVVHKGDPNAALALANAVTVGTGGSNNPRGVLRAVQSLADTCQPKPWIRPNSQLEVVFVSNQDNCVDGTACPGKAYAKASYLTDYLATIRTVGKTAHVHGVFMPPDVQACTCSLGLHPGNTYLNLVHSTGGAWGTICQEDYAPVLGAIGTGAAAAVRTTFTLSSTPAAGSLQVFIDNVQVTTGFTLVGNVLELKAPLADGHQLRVTYREVLATPQSTFVLRFPPVAGSVQVAVDGTAVPPANYTVNASVPSLTFTTPPALGATIAVSYTRDVPPTLQYQLEDTPVAGTLTVAVNGVVTTDYTFSTVADNSFVTFRQAPPAGAVLTFSYTAPGAPVLTYPFNLGATAPAGLTVVDAATGAAVSFTYANDQLTIAATAFQDGRKLTVSWPNTARDTFSVTLPNDPVAGSVTASAGAVSCTTPPQLIVTGRNVSVAGCPFAANASSVIVDYHYTEFNRVFTFTAPNLPGPTDFQVWTVTVNGTVVTDYTRAANVFTFTHDQPAGATLTITLVQQGP